MVLAAYISPGYFMDSDHPAVIEYAYQHGKGNKPEDKIIALYYSIRDGFRYNPYQLDLRPEKMKASQLVQQDSGYCIEKANLYAACAKVLGIPGRLCFANVRNHIGTEKLIDMLGTDILVFHGCTELYLRGKWVKATPAFNSELCTKLNVSPLEFDGNEDSVFQEFDQAGGRYMEYVKDHGHFADIPRDLFISELKMHYPKLFSVEDKLNIRPLIK